MKAFLWWLIVTFTIAACGDNAAPPPSCASLGCAFAICRPHDPICTCSHDGVDESCSIADVDGGIR